MSTEYEYAIARLNSSEGGFAVIFRNRYGEDVWHIEVQGLTKDHASALKRGLEVE